MYALRPEKLFLHEALNKNPDAMARVGRILEALDRAETELRVYNEGDALDVARELQEWPPADELPGVPLQHRRPLVFTRQQVEARSESDPRVAECEEGVRADLAHVLGYIDPVQDYHTYESDEKRNMVCWPTRDFGMVVGCSHGCYYCGQGLAGKYLALGMNVTEVLETAIARVIAETPQQRCFRMIGWGADMISLEPEYGVFADYLALLAAHDRYGYFHSNSDNVEWIAEVPHRDRLMGVWSLASEEVARLVEPGAPSAAARIEAMRKLNDMGVPVRIKLKPVVPIRGWREDYAALIAQVFARVKPETIGFCCLIWEPLAVTRERFGDLLDPELMAEAEAAEPEMRGQTHSPFPHETRARIYRHLIAEVRKHDRNVPIFLSTETREMWAELEEEVGQRARSFMCGCNPVQLPGPRMQLTEGIKHSTYFEPEQDRGDADHGRA